MSKKNNIAKKIKGKVSKINLQKNKFNTIELFLMFIMALLLGTLLGEMIFSNGSDTVSISKKINKNISEIENVYDTILDEYINEIDEEELKDAAIAGMMSILNDGYSTYYNEEDGSELKEELAGSFYGMGAEIYRDMKTGKVFVNDVYKDSPAEKAGIQKGDEYISINKENVAEKTTNEIANMIKGQNGKKIEIVVKRNNEEKTFTLTTAKVDIPSVKTEVLEENNQKIGYINISVFAINTDEQFEKALKELYKENIDKLIIDLRENTGGELESVINIASNFLNKKDVVVQTVSDKKTEKRYAVKNSVNKYSIVVLIDEGSASGSEVLAAALNENLNSPLVGKKTYGKGTVQKVKYLPSGGAIKYTVETWKTAKGNDIDGKGIEPTVKIDLSEDYAKTLDMKDDNQLQKAIEILLNK